jgi:hypothetical protein
MAKNAHAMDSLDDRRAGIDDVVVNQRRDVQHLQRESCLGQQADVPVHGGHGDVGQPSAQVRRGLGAPADGPFATDLRLSAADATTVRAVAQQRFGAFYAT